MANPLKEVESLGQSIWYDNIRRGMLESGELAGLIADGVVGLTSNPSIFEKALDGSEDYDEALQTLVGSGTTDPKELYEHLAVQDIQGAADLLHGVYERTEGRDGYACLEVSPYLAHDTRRTIEEARRLWRAVDRENVMIKVPATSEGLPAIEELIAEGLNVNVTLMFSLDVYDKVADAYWTGLERLSEAGGDLSRTASVASYFLSRIDTKVDDRLQAMLDAGKEPGEVQRLRRALLGKTAIACGKAVYARYQERAESERWKELERKGARPQRLLWASTSTKNPSYGKTRYVDELIGPDTVTTLPTETLQEFRKHGKAKRTLTEGVEEANETLQSLSNAGISLEEVTDELLSEGVRKFSDSFGMLLSTVESQRDRLSGGKSDRWRFSLGRFTDAWRKAAEEWRKEEKTQRLWSGDAGLWTGRDESQWLGWLRLPEAQTEHLEPLRRLAAEVRNSDIEHVVLLGMGGSSLCPWVLGEVFGAAAGFPELLVLDSVVPAQIRSVESRIDIEKTLFCVSSKSGSTMEPNVLYDHFRGLLEEALGTVDAGQRTIAVTDPGSPLEERARREGFRHVFYGLKDVGGRFSALTNFGLVPAAMLGVDLDGLLEGAESMMHACAACVPAEKNPGVALGLALGILAEAGRDKVTFVASGELRPLGAWLEQLLAESTGKEGKGLIPVADEGVDAPDTYESDRVFVQLREESAGDEEEERRLDALEKAGHPVLRLSIADRMDLGKEFYRWEFATAVAGSVLRINAFNQPDVESAKQAARRGIEALEKGERERGAPALVGASPITLHADERNAAALKAKTDRLTVDQFLMTFLEWIRPGQDYFAIQAFIEREEGNEGMLAQMRRDVRLATKAATTSGYGPRYLHSTGQLHKGGPNTGVFLLLTCGHDSDLPVPRKGYTFGDLAMAQALGDFEVLCQHGRRIVHVDLGGDTAAGLARLHEFWMRAARRVRDER